MVWACHGLLVHTTSMILEETRLRGKSPADFMTSFWKTYKVRIIKMKNK